MQCWLWVCLFWLCISWRAHGTAAVPVDHAQWQTPHGGSVIKWKNLFSKSRNRKGAATVEERISDKIDKPAPEVQEMDEAADENTATGDGSLPVETIMPHSP